MELVHPGRAKDLYWHWSPYNGWAIDHAIHGWNECLITYVLAASSPRYRSIPPSITRGGRAAGLPQRQVVLRHRAAARHALRRAAVSRSLFLLQLDPRGLEDQYADYWQLNVNHVRINRAHAIANPCKHKGYGANCWGLTASDDYRARSLSSQSEDSRLSTRNSGIPEMCWDTSKVSRPSMRNT